MPRSAFPAEDVRFDRARPEPAVAGHVRVARDAVDAWFEEDDQVHVHVRDPYVAALAKLTLTPPGARTVLRGPGVVSKRAVWAPPIPLADVKAIGRPMHATVNDVPLSAISKALGRYLQRRNSLQSAGVGCPGRGRDPRCLLQHPQQLGECIRRTGRRR